MNNTRSRKMLALAALAATASAAQACPDQKAPVAQGMKAFKDPVTGELTTPTARQAAELEAAKAAGAPSNPVARTAVPYKLPQGGIGVKLNESHMSEAVSEKKAPGTK